MVHQGVEVMRAEVMGRRGSRQGTVVLGPDEGPRDCLRLTNVPLGHLRVVMAPRGLQTRGRRVCRRDDWRRLWGLRVPGH